MDEFVEEYRRIRYGETDKVIKYFDEELKRIGKKLSTEEEDLTKYNEGNSRYQQRIRIERAGRNVCIKQQQVHARRIRTAHGQQRQTDN